MKQNLYNPVRPAATEVFVGREDLKRQLVRGLELAGMGFSLVGGPGIGKTSLLYAVQQELAESVKPLLPIYVDCMRHQASIEEILVTIIDGLVNTLSVQRSLSCPLEIVNDARTRARGGQQLMAILRPILDWSFDQDKQVHLPILLLDDLHRLYGSAQIGLLASLLQTAVNEQKISLVLATQQALVEELRNDVSPLRLLIAHQEPLKPFTPLETHALIAKAMQYGWPVEDGFADRAHQLTDGHPYRLHYYLLGILSQEEGLTLKGLQAQHDLNKTYLDSILIGSEAATKNPIDTESIDKIRSLVRNDQLKEALNELSHIKEYRLDVDLLMRQLNSIREQNRKGTMSYRDANAELNRIADAILRLIWSDK